ncbi:TnsA-like heteromeric transposase endonuclease subunit [Streptomyces sp. JB150]|uniref:TnsA-like heteromeric transposase endonuclease subunit n=1 Tax=Streptomyces sp. JB150 TaxID=2714844 RepID=UPI00140C77CF|nr:TnsA-like heteromeric transposase endonuclease subunit [Streptomyces sp. JB150]QIJ63924.1 TnsA-like heteromeric transposase endonuclease subunit [Streptomyces sp. JB150]
MSPKRSRTLRPVRHAFQQLFIHYYDAGGTERLLPADRAADVRFETCLPARDIPSYAGQKHTPGFYWAASSDTVLEYESFLEARWMKLLDFDANVACFAAQPFIFEGIDADGPWTHYPDLFVRRTDGSVLLLDVKNPEQVDKPKVQHQARRTATACATLGWDYQMVGEPDPQLWATVEWLAGYRRPLNAAAPVAHVLQFRAQHPVAIGELLSLWPDPQVERAVTYHLMWHHRLLFDLTQPLRDHTRVWTAPALEHA